MASETGVVNWLLKGIEHGKEALAAYAIYYRVFQFAVMPAIAASVAMLPFAARRIGEKDIRGVRVALKQVHVAGAAYIALVAPLLYVLAPPLARHLSNSPVTFDYLVPALRIVPLGALVTMPFFLCRPVFEGMGRGRPGLTMSVLRYAVLAFPAAAAGIALAPALHIPGFLGLIGGLMAAAAVSSVVFVLWARTALSTAANPTHNPPAAA